MTRIIGSIIVTLLLLTTSTSFGDCQLTLNNISNSITFAHTYNPFSNTPAHRETFQVRGVGRCDYFITATAGNSGDFLNRTATLTSASGSSTTPALTYQLYKTNKIDQRIVKAPPNLTINTTNPSQSQNAITGRIRRSRPQNRKLFIRINKGQFNRSGTYVDQFTLSAHEGFPSNLAGAATENINVTLTFNISPFTSLRLNKTQVDFGNPTSGERQDFKLFVRSSTNYDISVQSTSQSPGNLVHTTQPTLSSQIPYRLIFLKNKHNPTVTRHRLSNTNPAIILSGKTPTDRGETYKLRIKLDNNFEPLVAGKYEDTLTITLTTP